MEHRKDSVTWNLHMHTDTQATQQAGLVPGICTVASWSVMEYICARTQARQSRLLDFGKCRHTLITRVGSCAPSFGWHDGGMSSMRSGWQVSLH